MKSQHTEISALDAENHAKLLKDPDHFISSQQPNFTWNIVIRTSDSFL